MRWAAGIAPRRAWRVVLVWGAPGGWRELYYDVATSSEARRYVRRERARPRLWPTRVYAVPIRRSRADAWPLLPHNARTGWR